MANATATHRFAIVLTTQGIWDVHAAGCADLTKKDRRRGQHNGEAEVVEAANAAAAVDAYLDDELVEMGYGAESFRILPCAAKLGKALRGNAPASADPAIAKMVAEDAAAEAQAVEFRIPTRFVADAPEITGVEKVSAARIGRGESTLMRCTPAGMDALLVWLETTMPRGDFGYLIYKIGVAASR